MGCIEKSILEIRLLMLGTVELWGDKRSMMSLFFPDYFLIATPIELILKNGKGGLEKGLITNASSTSFCRSLSTVSGSDCS